MVSTGGFFKPVVIKLLRRELHEHIEGVNGFEDEARLAARLTHPNTSLLVDFGTIEDRRFIAMEHYPSIPLSRLSSFTSMTPVKLHSPTWVALACRGISDAAEGLHAAHGLTDDHGESLGVVHNDISPRCIAFGMDGTVKLQHFGNAHFRDRKSGYVREEHPRSLAYLSPEQLRGNYSDPRSDQWGLGVSLWEALTGRILFTAPTDAELQSKIETRPIPPPSRFNPAIPPFLDKIVLRTLSRDPNGRYKTARDLASALSSATRRLEVRTDPLTLSLWLQDHCGPDIRRQERLVRELADREDFEGVTEVDDAYDLPLPSSVSQEQMALTEPATAASTPEALLASSLAGAKTQDSDVPDLTLALLVQASARWLRIVSRRPPIVFASGLAMGVTITLLFST